MFKYNCDSALLQEKAKKIKAVAFDVDGVLTDGSLTFDENGVEYKTFNAKDGQGIVMLTKTGFVTAIITARANGTVRHRFENLGMTKLFEGCKNKQEALDELCKEFDITYDEVAYMGDDLPDVCVLERVGFTACPADAVQEVKEIVHAICENNGGRGAVREFCDYILEQQNKNPFKQNRIQSGVCS